MLLNGIMVHMSNEAILRPKDKAASCRNRSSIKLDCSGDASLDGGPW
jgi:hypothetical protein